MTREEFVAFGMKNLPLFQVLTVAHFSGRPYKAPSLEFGEDDTSYYDSNRNLFHIGLGMVWELFAPVNEEDAYNAIKYVCMHEWQHRLSTATAPFARAVDRGVREIVKYIADTEEKKPPLFRNGRDCDMYLDVTLRGRGIILPRRHLEAVAHYVANSIEDGRIERLCSAAYSGFEPLRLVYRGRFWDHQVFESDGELSPSEHLNAVLSQILSLSTTGLYQKGFLRACAGTTVIGEVEGLMPCIGRGVASGRTRGMESETVSICRVIAPTVWKAVKDSQKDLAEREAVAAVLKELIRRMAEKLSEINLNERDEVSDDGGLPPSFPISDLVVELDDELFDRLEKEGKLGEEKGGLKVKRKNPKPEEKKAEEGKTEGKTGGEHAESDAGGDTGASEGGEASSDGPGGSPGGGSPEGEAGKGGNSGGNSGGDDGTGAAAGGSPEGSAAEGSSTESPGGQKSGGRTKGGPRGIDIKSADTGKAVHEGGREAGGGADAARMAEELVRKAVHDAETLAREDAADTLSTVNQADRVVARADVRSETKDHEPAVSPADAGKVMGDADYSFKELIRDYPVDEDLPPALKAKGRALHKQYERYFHSRRSMTVTHLDRGSVDPDRLYALAIGDTDVFRKRGKDRLFDGCCYILIDNSGSMSSGTKFREACTAAALIEESFNGLFPVKIASFSDTYDTVIHQRIKGWTERSLKNCTWSYYRHKSPSGGNADGCTIGIAADEILKRPERKKLIVVLSDGAPTEGSENPVELTKRQVAAARKKGVCIAGIYFENGCVGRYSNVFQSIYGKGKFGICTTTDKIYKALEKVIQDFVRS